MRKPILITTPGRSVEETAQIMGVSRKRLKELVELARELTEEIPFKRTAPRKKNSGKGIANEKRT
jgi:hypothetical protein